MTWIQDQGQPEQLISVEEFAVGVCKNNIQNRYRSSPPPPASSLRWGRRWWKTCPTWRILSKGNSRQHRNWSRYRTRDWSWMRRPTSTWWLLRNRVRTGNWFEAVNRNSVCSRPHLYGEKLAWTSQELEGTTVHTVEIEVRVTHLHEQTQSLPRPEQ